MFAAVLDTSVLWPSLQRDFLLSLAVQNLYRPLWSSVILDELEFEEADKLVRRGEAGAQVAAERARHLITEMTTHFDDALVEGWEPHEGEFGLPDPDDEHVVAAAVVGGAGAIVTSNVRDFPSELIPHTIHVFEPAAFAANTVSVSPDDAVRAVEQMARRRRLPPRNSVDEVLDALQRIYHLAEAVEMIRSAADRSDG